MHVFSIGRQTLDPDLHDTLATVRTEYKTDSFRNNVIKLFTVFWIGVISTFRAG